MRIFCYSMVFLTFAVWALMGNPLYVSSAWSQSPMNQPAAPGPEPGGSGPAAPESDERFISIDFNDVDIDVFIKFISELTGKNFVVDNRVRGKVTIISPTRISIDEAYTVFESVLEVQGFSLVDAGEVTKIIPSPYARTMNIETRTEKSDDPPIDKMVTQLIRMKYADPNEVRQLVAPLVSKSSVVLAYAPTNMLIITDVYSNIQRLMRIIEAIDVTGIGKQISAVQVNYANSTEMVKILDSLFNAEAEVRKRGGQRDVTLVPDVRSNIVVVLASETDTDRVRRLIQMLDRELPRGKGGIHVYRLENAKAEDLVQVLLQIPGKEIADPAKGMQVAPVVSQDVRISADKATNSLIIVAEKDDYEVLRGVIEQLDIRRAMVYIECLIMEINKDKSLNLGTEWMIGDEVSYRDKDGVWGGGFSGGAMGGDPGFFSSMAQQSGAAGMSAPLPPGFSVGVFGESITMGNIAFPSIAAVINAYKRDRDVHILSTPQLLTTDNETARITVGKNVPYLTRAATGETNFSNYEYKDVGISLEVTPQISKDRKIRLEITQEVNKLETTTALFQPTTLKRTVSTTVLVDDKNTVVIGGLIDDAISSTEYRVPCLGSIPGLGWLFRSSGRSNEKTNLYVFLTPHVVETPEEAKVIHDRKEKVMRDLEEEQIKLYDSGKGLW
jgi:general secretion pathway protein D